MASPPKRAKIIPQMSSDVIISVFSFLKRSQLSTVSVTHRHFHRIVGAHFEKFPLHCEERVEFRVGIIDPKHGDIPTPEKVASRLKIGEFRARETHFHVGLMFLDRMEDVDEFFGKYRADRNWKSEGTTLVEMFRGVETYLPQLSALWTDSTLHIHLHVAFTFDELDPSDSYLSAFEADNDFTFHDNYLADFVQVLFDDAHEQNFGALLARSARLVVGQADGNDYYAPFDRLAAIHRCANFELPGLLVYPQQLADFLGESGVMKGEKDDNDQAHDSELANDNGNQLISPSSLSNVPTRNFILNCYYIDVDELIREMQCQLKQDFLASRRPRFFYKCTLSVNANSDIEMPEAFAVANAHTGETLRMWPDETRSESERESEEIYFIQRAIGSL